MTTTLLPETPVFDPTQVQTTPEKLGNRIADYRENGFVKVPGIISKAEAAFYYEEALRLAKENSANKASAGVYRKVLNQTVNAWQISDTMKALTLHPNVAAVAKALAGVPLRIWHDHILAKDPHNGAQTEWHQDQPYWPHANSANPISAWIALCDVPVEKGSMSFIAGQQERVDLTTQILSDPRSLFNLAPDLEWEPKVTLPLQAGDCTFHHGRTPHMANANQTDDYRVAHVIIYMDATTTFTGKGHLVTKPLELEAGARLDGPLFPEV